MTPILGRDDRDYLRDFYQAVDIQQGNDRRLVDYYVPIYDMPGMQEFDLVPKLRRAVEFSAGQSVQLLSGFRGCGKTSELLRLKRELEAEDYTVAYMDIDHYFNTRLPMQMERLPIAIAAGFASALQKDPALPPLQRFWEFLKRIRLDVSGSLEAPGGSVDLTAVIREDTSFGAEVRTAFRENRSTFRQEFHAFFRDVQSHLGDRDVVFIVDSIDHWRGSADQFEVVRESVEMAFTALADDLKIPNLHVIYTIPIYLDVPWFANKYAVVNVKLASRDGSRFDPGHDALHAVLAKRAPGGQLDRLLPPPERERVVAATGGHFRDLLRLCREVALETRSLPVEDDALGRAEMTLRNGYTSTLTQEQVDLLRHVSKTKSLFIPQKQSADELALITLGAILRYPNAESTWHDVHPLLRPIL